MKVKQFGAAAVSGWSRLRIDPLTETGAGELPHRLAGRNALGQKGSTGTGEAPACIPHPWLCVKMLRREEVGRGVQSLARTEQGDHHWSHSTPRGGADGRADDSRLALWVLNRSVSIPASRWSNLQCIQPAGPSENHM